MIFSQIKYTLENPLDILRKREEIINNKSYYVLDEVPTSLPNLSIFSFHVSVGKLHPLVESSNQVEC